MPLQTKLLILIYSQIYYLQPNTIKISYIIFHAKSIINLRNSNKKMPAIAGIIYGTVTLLLLSNT